MSLDIKKILRKIKPDSNVILLFVLLVFSCAVWSMISNVKIETEDVPNYGELTMNPYEKFEKLIQKTKLQEVINSGQFKELDYEDNRIIEYTQEKEGNLFEKKF